MKKMISRAQEDRALELHKKAIVIDTHCDTILKFLPRITKKDARTNLGTRIDFGHLDLPRILEGGLSCQTFAIGTGFRENQPDALFTAIQLVSIFQKQCELNDIIVHIQNPLDIKKAKDEGKLSAILSLEGSECLMGDLDVLRVFYKLGIRMISFTWNWRTPFADGLYAKRSESKLTDLGVKALEEMDEIGIVFDVSHLADSCFWDVVDIKKTPFIASHSNCRKVFNHERNLTDDMIVALADHNGVIGISFYPLFISKENATVEKVVDHIDHVVDIVGPDYVGLGSDFDGIASTPEGLEDVSKIPNITRELVRREYNDEDILKILGGNHLRVFNEVMR